MSSVGTKIGNDVWRKGGQMIEVTCSFGAINARHRWRSQRSRSPRNAGSSAAAGAVCLPKLKQPAGLKPEGCATPNAPTDIRFTNITIQRSAPHAAGTRIRRHPRSLRWSTSINSSHNCLAKRRRIRRDATTKSHWTCLIQRQYKSYCCRITRILY
jgi:hypothetical protein